MDNRCSGKPFYSFISHLRVLSFLSHCLLTKSLLTNMLSGRQAKQSRGSISSLPQSSWKLPTLVSLPSSERQQEEGQAQAIYQTTVEHAVHRPAETWRSFWSQLSAPSAFTNTVYYTYIWMSCRGTPIRRLKPNERRYISYIQTVPAERWEQFI